MRIRHPDEEIATKVGHRYHLTSDPKAEIHSLCAASVTDRAEMKRLDSGNVSWPHHAKCASSSRQDFTERGSRNSCSSSHRSSRRGRRIFLSTSGWIRDGREELPHGAASR